MSCHGAPAAPVPRAGECVPDSKEEYDETGQRRDNCLQTKSGLGFLEGCQSERIYSSETVWKDRTNNNIIKEEANRERERERRGEENPTNESTGTACRTNECAQGGRQDAKATSRKQA